MLPRGRFLGGFGGQPFRVVCHCLLIEAGHRLVLVDTGLGTADLAAPAARLGWSFFWAVRPTLDQQEPAASQLQRLGLNAADVTDVVMTHLDVDHAGGLADFPRARVHVMGAELEAARAPQSMTDRDRYRACQWAHEVQWEPYEPGTQTWHGLPGATTLRGLPPELLLVPLPGHTAGHCGVAVDTGRGWLLHAGDAFVCAAELGDPAAAPAVWRLYHRLLDGDRAAWEQTRAALGRLAVDDDQVRVFCSHDPQQLEEFAKEA